MRDEMQRRQSGERRITVSTWADAIKVPNLKVLIINLIDIQTHPGKVAVALDGRHFR
jgi:hypothetical protein